MIEALHTYIRAHYKRLGMVSEQTDYSQAFSAEMTTRATTGKDLLLINEDFLSSDVDFSSALLRLKAKGIEALFINTQSEFSFLTLFTQARRLFPKLQIFGTSMPGSDAFLEKAGSQADGIIFADVPKAADLLQGEGRAMYDRFVAKFGKPLSWDTGVLTSYEALRAMHAAMLSGEEPRKFLYRSTFDGVFGRWHFDRNGDIQGLASVLKTIRNSAVVPLPPL